MRVPVLSKTMKFTLPLTLTLGGEMQKIFLPFSLASANTVPMVIAAGNAGGTAMVTKLRERSIMLTTPY